METGDDKALGRHANGGFVLRRFELAATAKTATEPKPVEFETVAADYSQKKFEVANLLAGMGDGWAVETMKAENKVRRSAYFTLKDPLDLPEGGTLTFTLRHSDKHPGANLKRFRLYTTTSAHVAPSTNVPQEIRGILAVAPEKLSRGGANLACASRTGLANGSTNEIESVLARETQTTRSDRVAIR